MPRPRRLCRCDHRSARARAGDDGAAGRLEPVVPDLARSPHAETEHRGRRRGPRAGARSRRRSVHADAGNRRLTPIADLRRDGSRIVSPRTAIEGSRDPDRRGRVCRLANGRFRDSRRNPLLSYLAGAARHRKSRTENNTTILDTLDRFSHLSHMGSEADYPGYARTQTSSMGSDMGLDYSGVQRECTVRSGIDSGDRLGLSSLTPPLCPRPYATCRGYPHRAPAEHSPERRHLWP